MSVETGPAEPDREMRSHILAAAARLFHERGYSGTTARDIARDVGVSSGSVFHHFTTKENVLLAVVEDGLREATSRMDLIGSRGMQPRAQLSAMIHAHISTLVDGSPAATSVLFYERSSLSEQSRLRLIEMRDAYEQVWDAALERLGGKYEQIAYRRLARLLLFGSMNWTAQWYHPGGRFDVDAIVTSLTARFAR